MASFLVVDDEASARSTLALVLKTQQHGVVEADGVSAAATHLRRQVFDMVITDLRMADGDGLEVIRETRRSCPMAEVILLTAYADWESAKEAIRLGARDYFEKSGEPELLLERINLLLRERRLDPAGPPLADILTATAALEGVRACVTVLFADLRDSMAILAGRSLDEARRTLDDVIEIMQDAVHRQGGTVNQVMGDGVMALFGAPIACDDHATRACAAATAMHQAIAGYTAARCGSHGAELHIRVGLSSGPVILRSVGGDVRRDYTAVGPATHLAARMEQLARPGTTLLTAETRDLADGRVCVVPRGLVPVKGLARPVEVVELLGFQELAGS
jgi:class 3 adenylate cyclase